MTDNNRTRLEQQEAALEREIERRKSPSLSATEAQILAARGHTGRPQEPEVEEDTSRWSATDHQVFVARGTKPPKRRETDEDER
jgi:hypothetical protein